ncbi:MAG: serine hydrolase domain-containing protein [Gemmatimonadales bacterium]
MIAITALFALAQTAVPTATPSQVGLNPELLELARRTLAAEVDSGAFPGAVMAVGRRGRLVLTAAVGVYGGDDSRPVTDSTMYDLASLTKVVALTTAVAHLVSTGALNVDQTVGSILDEFATGERAAVTVRHLLTHTTGLPAWRPLFTETESPQEALELALTTPLERPPGEPEPLRRF